MAPYRSFPVIASILFASTGEAPMTDQASATLSRQACAFIVLVSLVQALLFWRSQPRVLCAAGIACC